MAEQRSRRIQELTDQIPHVGPPPPSAITSSSVPWRPHHSGQLPAWKLTIETLMTEGLLDAVFATSTVAAGVNFPARTIVFSQFRPGSNGREFLALSSTELHQMTGRGRPPGHGQDRLCPGPARENSWTCA